MRGPKGMPSWAPGMASLLLVCAAGCKGKDMPLPLAEAQKLDGGGARVPMEVDDPPASAADAGVVKAAVINDAPSEAPAAAPPATVRISIRSSPRASVQWGRKTLGTTPLSIERPRESGPMDLVLYAKGFLPVHTRAYTFRNDSLGVDMTPLSKKDTLLGARKAPPAPPPGSTPDGGAP